MEGRLNNKKLLPFDEKQEKVVDFLISDAKTKIEKLKLQLEQKRKKLYEEGLKKAKAQMTAVAFVKQFGVIGSVINKYFNTNEINKESENLMMTKEVTGLHFNTVAIEYLEKDSNTSSSNGTSDVATHINMTGTVGEVLFEIVAVLDEKCSSDGSMFQEVLELEINTDEITKLELESLIISTVDEKCLARLFDNLQSYATIRKERGEVFAAMTERYPNLVIPSDRPGAFKFWIDESLGIQGQISWSVTLGSAFHLKSYYGLDFSRDNDKTVTADDCPLISDLEDAFPRLLEMEGIAGAMKEILKGVLEEMVEKNVQELMEA